MITREQAIARIQESRRTHLDWIEHLKACSECRAAAEAGSLDVGGHEHHERCVKKYDEVIAYLEAT